MSQIRGRQKLNPHPPSPEFLEEMARVYWTEAQKSNDSSYHMKVASHLEQRAKYDRARRR